MKNKVNVACDSDNGITAGLRECNQRSLLQARYDAPGLLCKSGNFDDAF